MTPKEQTSYIGFSQKTLTNSLTTSYRVRKGWGGGGGGGFHYFGIIHLVNTQCFWPMGSISNGTSSFHNDRMEGKVVGSRPIGCVCNFFPIKKERIHNAFLFMWCCSSYDVIWCISLFHFYSCGFSLSLSLSHFLMHPLDDADWTIKPQY
jgi:hypothetical protein